MDKLLGTYADKWQRHIFEDRTTMNNFKIQSTKYMYNIHKDIKYDTKRIHILDCFKRQLNRKITDIRQWQKTLHERQLMKTN